MEKMKATAGISILISVILYVYASFNLLEAKAIRRDLGARIEVANSDLQRIDAQCRAILTSE